MKPFSWPGPRPGRRWHGLCLLGVVLGAGWLAVPHARAWYHLRQARREMARYRPDLAGPHLEACAQVWPDSLTVGLLASRAARQRGDFEVADRHLRHCQRLVGGESSPEVALEWSLFQASVGNLREVDGYLQRQIEREPRLSPLVWEALVDGYIRTYRLLDAMQCLEHWLTLDPDDVRALSLRGYAFRLGGSWQRGADDLRRVVQADPDRHEDRWQLVLCLLNLGAYEEALDHLAEVEQRRPADPEVQVRQARCLNMLGRRNEAEALLDAILEHDPRHALALRTRGQIRLTQRQGAEAERWLRRAAEAAPTDFLVSWLLFQALSLQNKADEAAVQLEKANDLRDRSERLGDLRGRRMSENPLDPTLHHEMGLLLQRGGQEEQAETWFHSALRLDRAYRPAHQRLAELYRKRGDTARAREHARQAGE